MVDRHERIARFAGLLVCSLEQAEQILSRRARVLDCMGGEPDPYRECRDTSGRFDDLYPTRPQSARQDTIE